MRSFAIESTGAYLGEFEIANPFAAVKAVGEFKPIFTVKYKDEIRLVRIVGIADEEGETLIPPGESESIQALVFYAVPVLS
jgi:hypothetical protein